MFDSVRSFFYLSVFYGCAVSSSAFAIRDQIKNHADRPVLAPELLRQFAGAEKSELQRQKEAREEARKQLLEEQKKAFLRLKADDLYTLYTDNYKRLVEKLKSQKDEIEKMKNDGMPFPGNADVLEKAILLQFKEFTEGPIAKKTKAYADMEAEERGKRLANDKDWLIQVLGRTEMVDALSTFTTKYADVVKGLTKEERGRVGERDFWIAMLELAGQDTKESFATEKAIKKHHANSILLGDRSDIVDAHPPEMVVELRHFKDVMSRGTDRQAANQFYGMALGFSGRRP